MAKLSFVVTVMLLPRGMLNKAENEITESHIILKAVSFFQHFFFLLNVIRSTFCSFKRII